MDSYILYNILEFIDNYQVNDIFDIKAYETNINDIIDIELNNQIIKEEKLKEEWKDVFTNNVINNIINTIKISSIYIQPELLNYIKINTILNNFINIKKKFIINLEIKKLFTKQYSQILRSRLSLRNHIKYHNDILMPGTISLDFLIMKKYYNYKFLE